MTEDDERERHNMRAQIAVERRLCQSTDQLRPRVSGVLLICGNERLSDMALCRAKVGSAYLPL
jgi:hypothetical protein